MLLILQIFDHIIIRKIIMFRNKVYLDLQARLFELHA